MSEATENTETNLPENGPEEAAPPPRKKKSWGKRFLLLLLGLIGLLLLSVGLAPTIVSTDAGRQFALSQAQQFLPGKVEAGSWSLGWFSGQTIENLRIVDPDEREVLTAKSITLSDGLLQLATGGLNFGTVTITEPKVLLHLDESGAPTIGQAFVSESTEPAPPSESGSLPEVRGKLTIIDGQVTVARDGLPNYEVTDLDTALELDTFNRATGELTTQLPGGRQLSAKVGLDGLAPEGQFDVAQAGGSGEIRTDGPVDIGTLVSLLANQPDLTGQAELDVTLNAGPGKLAGVGNLRVHDLSSGQAATRPLNMALVADVGLEGEQVRGDVTLKGAAEFLRVQASGTTEDLTATLASDLAKLHQELAQALDLGELRFGGQASGNIALKKSTDGYDADVALTVAQLLLKNGGQDLQAAEVQLKHTGPFTGGSTIRGNGSLTMRDVVAGGKPLDPQAEVRWQDLSLGDAIQVAKLEVQATPIQLTANGLQVDPATNTIGDGKLELQADLGKTMQLVSAINGGEPAQLTGQVNFAAQVKANGAEQQLQGTGAIKQLVIGSGEGAIQEAEIGLNLDATIDPKAGNVRLGNNRITSEKLNLAVQGDIQDYAGRAVANLSGNYELSWPAITALLHELAPDTREVISIQGNSKSDLSLQGALNDPTATPSFAALTGQLGIGWEGIDLLGIPISAARFEPKLANAVVTVPVASMTAAQGKVNLGGTLDLKPPATTLTLPGTTKLLDGVAITPQLAQDLLSRINPIFYGVVDASGTINVSVTDLNLPFGDTLASEGRGSGALELIEMRVQPAGLIGQIAQLGGFAEATEMLAIQLEGGTFELKDGRVGYEKFTIIFPEDFDLIFRGSVGFDDTLDLVVSVPIRADLLKKFGVAGDAARYAEMLHGTRVDIPVTGTRQQPNLDFAAVDTEKLLKDVLEGELNNTGKAVLDGVLGGESKDGEKKKPLGGLLDGLKGDDNKDGDKP